MRRVIAIVLLGERGVPVKAVSRGVVTFYFDLVFLPWLENIGLPNCCPLQLDYIELLQLDISRSAHESPLCSAMTPSKPSSVSSTFKPSPAFAAFGT